MAKTQTRKPFLRRARVTHVSAETWTMVSAQRLVLRRLSPVEALHLLRFVRAVTDQRRP